MENKIFSMLSVGFVVNLIIVSLLTTCYVDFTAFGKPLPPVKKGDSIVNINGY